MKKNKVLLLVSLLAGLPLGLSCMKYEPQPINEPQIAFADETSDSSETSETASDSTDETSEDESDLYDTISQWSKDVENVLNSVGGIIGISGASLLAIVMTAIKMLIPNKRGLRKLREEFKIENGDLLKALNNDKEAIAKLEQANKADREFFMQSIKLLANLSRNAKAKEIVENVNNYINGGE